jgi:hypothetical protein
MSNAEWATLREELRAASKRSTGARVADSKAAAAYRKVDSLDAKRAARLATIDEANRRAASLKGKGPTLQGPAIAQGCDVRASVVSSIETKGPQANDELERRFLSNWDALG